MPEAPSSTSKLDRARTRLDDLSRRMQAATDVRRRDAERSTPSFVGPAASQPPAYVTARRCSAGSCRCAASTPRTSASSSSSRRPSSCSTRFASESVLRACRNCRRPSRSRPGGTCSLCRPAHPGAAGAHRHRRRARGRPSPTPRDRAIHRGRRTTARRRAGRVRARPSAAETAAQRRLDSEVGQGSLAVPRATRRAGARARGDSRRAPRGRTTDSLARGSRSSPCRCGRTWMSASPNCVSASRSSRQPTRPQASSRTT